MRAARSALLVLAGGLAVAVSAPAGASAPSGVLRAFDALDAETRAGLTACGVDADALDRQLALDLEAFDQDMNGGWRAVSRREGCEAAAGDLITAYLRFSAPTPPDRIRKLRWHAGQVLAAAGRVAEARAYFAGSYDAEPDTEWNLYVDATLAFIDEDREALQAARDALAAREVSEEMKAARRRFLAENPDINMPEGFVDEPQNLTVVERLLACIGRPYGEAYGECEG